MINLHSIIWSSMQTLVFAQFPLIKIWWENISFYWQIIYKLLELLSFISFENPIPFFCLKKKFLYFWRNVRQKAKLQLLILLLVYNFWLNFILLDIRFGLGQFPFTHEDCLIQSVYLNYEQSVIITWRLSFGFYLFLGEGNVIWYEN